MDRGEKSAECMQYIMERKNIVYILGNHDLMFLTYYYGRFNFNVFERGEIDDKYACIQEALNLWFQNGGRVTRESFQGDVAKIKAVYDYLLGCPVSKTVTVGKTKYTLAHSLYCDSTISEEAIHEEVLNFDHYLDEDTVYRTIQNAVWERVRVSYSQHLQGCVHLFGHTISKKYHMVPSYLPYCEVHGKEVSVKEFQTLKPKDHAMVGLDTGCAKVSTYEKDRGKDTSMRPRLTCLCLDSLSFTYVYKPKKASHTI
jgi:hypothetical protein